MAKVQTIADVIAARDFGVSLGKRAGDQRTVPLAVRDYPVNSLMAIFEYGVQRYFNDRAGGSDKTLADKVELVQKLDEALKRGEIGLRRTAKAGTDPLTAEIRSIVREKVKAKVGKEAWKDAWADADDLDERLDKVFENQSDEVKAGITEKAEAALEAKRQAAAARAAVSAEDIAL